MLVDRGLPCNLVRGGGASVRDYGSLLTDNIGFC